MVLLYLLVGLLILVVFTEGAIGFYKASNKIKYVITRLLLLITVSVLLFVFGPLLAFSPVQFGYETRSEGKVTIIYPTDSEMEFVSAREVIKKAKQAVLAIHKSDSEVRFLLTKSRLDMLRFGSKPSADVSGGVLGINLRQDRLDEGALTHELSHYYLYDSTNKIPFYFPRWFDEGLALYLGSPEKAAQIEPFRKSVNDGMYYGDLSYWSGAAGYVHWLLKDYSHQPVDVSTQFYFLTKFLVENYGVDKVAELIDESKSSKTFYIAFEKVYEMSVEEFHRIFIDSI